MRVHQYYTKSLLVSGSRSAALSGSLVFVEFSCCMCTNAHMWLFRKLPALSSPQAAAGFN